MTPNWSDEDLDLLTRTIAGEAGGESYDGQVAVAQVIRNRMNDSRFPNSIKDVVMQPKQFSAWNSGVGGNSIPQNLDPNSDMYRTSREAALAALSGEVADVTGGATHYFSPAGMQDHVNKGEQSNLLPSWLEAEASRRGEEGNVTIGGHIFTGRSEGYEAPAEGNIETSRLLPADIQGALRQGPGALSVRDSPQNDTAFNPVSGKFEPLTPIPEQIPFDQIGQPVQRKGMGMGNTPTASAAGPTGAGATGPTAGGGSNGFLSTKDASAGLPQENSRSVLGNILGYDNPAWLTDDRSDQLLALGAGILSGNNWSEGLGNGAGNILGMRMQDKADDRQAGVDALEHQRELELDRASASSSMVRAGNIEMKDGSQRGDLRFDGTNYIDPEGNPVTAQVSRALNNSDAFGSRGQLSAQQALDASTRLTSMGNELESLDRVYAGLENVDYGIAGFQTEMETFMKTLVGKGLTPEEISRAAVKGELQGLVGATREQVVGGGVMTEQDAVRVIMALGGDLSILSNPDVMREQLGKIRQQKLNVYDSEFDFYKSHNETYKNLNYPDVTRYGGPSLDKSNEGGNDADIEQMLKNVGL